VATYGEFLAAKVAAAVPAGFDPPDSWLPAAMKPHQRDVTRWNCRMGRSADFAERGLGKTLIELGFCRCCCLHTGGPALLLAPLAVGRQIVREAERFGVPDVRLVSSQDEVRDGTNVTNYQKLHKFRSDRFAVVGMDESSIVKDHTSATRNDLTDFCRSVPYLLPASACPAPNDHEELGNHAELLGVMTRAEMLATYFVHDSGDTSKWRLKGHAEGEFWRWVATWAVLMRRPSDLGYPDDGYDLPPLTVHEHWIAGGSAPGYLFAVPERTLTGRRKARRSSVAGRVETAVALARAAASAGRKVIVWCELNDEQAAFAGAFGAGCVSIAGATREGDRIELESRWREGPVPVLVTKGAIFGHGMNWQCSDCQIFLGIGDSYERFYQCVGRSWRYGQPNPVDIHIVTGDGEALSWKNIQRKQRDHETLQAEVVRHTAAVNRLSLTGGTTPMTDAGYQTGRAAGQGWTLLLGDCVERVREIPDGSIHYSVFSPPFASLYTYSDSPRDMGNARGADEFLTHFGFLAAELLRMLIPGRLVSFHCTQIPLMKERDGVIGRYDFRGDLIRVFEAAGFIFHSEVFIGKDPVVEMQRTKALGLLHKQVVKDSAMSRQGTPDYLVTLRKPGNNPEPIVGRFEDYVGLEPPDPIRVYGPDPAAPAEEAEKAARVRNAIEADRYSIEVWQRYASPVWADIDQTRVLAYTGARDERDERHICPLQLDVIGRCLDLWTNPGDLVLSPFAGVGSEGYCSVKAGRRYFGVELKRSYFEQAVRHLTRAEREARQPDLFASVADAEGV
jgi:hypothetical protein